MLYMDGGAFAAINTCFKLVDFCTKLNDVSLESRVFLRLIQRVRDDLDESFRLMRLAPIQGHFAADPGKKTHVEGCIVSAKKALESIGRFVEGVRVEEERTGRIGLASRFEWVLRHQAKLQTRERELDTCHRSLLDANASMRLWEMNPLLPTYSAAIGQASAQPKEGDSDDIDILLPPHERLRRRKEQKEENLIDLDGSYVDDLKAISPDAGQIPVAESFAPMKDAFNSLPPPNYADIKVMRTEVEIPSVAVDFAPGTGIFDEKPKVSFPLDEKPKIVEPWESSVTRKPLPAFDFDTKVPEKSKLEEPVVVMQEPKTWKREGKLSSVELPADFWTTAPVEQSTEGPVSQWGPENYARPGWEIFVPELDCRPIGKSEKRGSMENPVELEDTSSGLRAASLMQISQAPAPAITTSDPQPSPSQEVIAAELPVAAAPRSKTPFRPDEMAAAPAATVSSLHTSDPGPAPYVPASLLQSPSEVPVRSVSRLHTIPALERAPKPISQTEPDTSPQAMWGFVTRYGPVSSQYLEADPVQIFDSQGWRRTSVPASSPSSILRRPVSRPTYPGLQPQVSGLMQRPAISQDSMKEVQIPPAEISRRLVSPTPPALPIRHDTDSMKELGLRPVPPVPPKLPQLPVSERIDSGFVAEDTMKESFPSLQEQANALESDTSKFVAEPEAHTSKEIRSQGDRKSLLEIGEEAARRANAEKTALQKRKATMHLMLGDGDDI